MVFWIFMLITSILIPIIMIIAGKAFTKNAPKNINPIYGYRTEMSMKNRDTWEFAHNYCGRLWLRLGIILLVISTIPMLCVIGKNTDTVGTVGSVICILDVLVLITSIFPTEKALKKNFDKNGNRKK